MDTLQCIRFCINLLVGSSLLYFPGYCLHRAAHSSQVPSYDPESSTNTTRLQALSSFEKFMMQSYFDKHESLIDTHFDNFIAQEVSLNLCEALSSRILVLERNLIGEGSHRHLSTSTTFQIGQSGSISKLSSYSCEFVLIERLPHGVFADPFELQHLLQRGVFSGAAVFGDKNLELPSFLSNRSAVEIHLDVGPNVMLSPIDINVELPLHARYPPLHESGYSAVEFGAPDMFVRCRTKEKISNQSCLLMLTSDGAKLKSGDIIWRIPSGIRAHAGVVSSVTFISALLSTLLIVLTSLCYSDSKLCKVLKQSYNL
ncbi:Phosphatidylinositol-glycan biosynthesis class X protein [Quillaja saponaria]|uniref:Phosphatidylinositol-glycan biosynthesis class X protein n=1 Tax=Quillaja saponaria TaxID=32244 RepID=A0AAD7P6G4_QUISA|nr:Phosphatidylinositol-glycan biosynthesis class X protein [Quillaja saponaria]